jgi:hypothetical protein
VVIVVTEGTEGSTPKANVLWAIFLVWGIGMIMVGLAGVLFDR